MEKRFTVCGIVSVFLIFLFTGCALASTDDKWNLSANDNSWNNSREIVITENAGKILTEYPVPVGLNSSNFNFSMAKSDGSDLRFSSGDKTLNYWIEKWDPENKEAVIWVKIPSLPANGTRKILMRYGNPGATAASSGENTFDFFDNFDGSNLNGLDWNAESAGGGMVDVNNGNCTIAAPKVHAYDSSMIYSKGSFNINSIFVVKRMKVTTGTDNRGPLLWQGFIDQVDSRKNDIKHKTELANESRVGWETAYRKERHNLFDLTDVNVPEGEWYVSGVAWYEENDTRKVAWFKNGVRDSRMDFASNDYITNFPMHIYLYAASYQDASKNTGYMAVDYVLVRKFVETEPTARVISTKAEPEVSAEDLSENISENISKSEVISEPKVVSEPQATPGSELNSETSNSGGVAQAQENLSQEEAGTPEVFPEYDVGISGIKLSSSYGVDFPALVKELNSSRINTIFLSVNSEDVWQSERFVKTAHENGISVHAVILEDLNCTEKGAEDACQASLNTVLDYNGKSLAPFDGIDIYVKPSPEESDVDYGKLFETGHQGAGGNISISASLPLNYTASQIEKIAPFVDSFIIRAYSGEPEELNSVPGIVDAIALEMGEIRGAGSRGIIEISVEEGFKDKVSIQELFAGLADYYSNDSAFLGVSISNYDNYRALPLKAGPEEKKSPIPGFEALSVFVAGLGAFALLKVKRN